MLTPSLHVHFVPSFWHFSIFLNFNNNFDSKAFFESLVHSVHSRLIWGSDTQSTFLSTNVNSVVVLTILHICFQIFFQMPHPLVSSSRKNIALARNSHIVTLSLTHFSCMVQLTRTPIRSHQLPRKCIELSWRQLWKASHMLVIRRRYTVLNFVWHLCVLAFIVFDRHVICPTFCLEQNIFTNF